MRVARNVSPENFLVENRLLRGDYRFPELADLSEDERDILLDAVTVLFLERNVCFRETFNKQILLVFPSLINEKRPADNLEPVEEVTYRVRGACPRKIPTLRMSPSRSNRGRIPSSDPSPSPETKNSPTK